MKNLIKIIIFLFTIKASFAQGLTANEAVSSNKLYEQTLELLNKSFSNLEEDGQISKIERKFDIKIDNPFVCLLLLSSETKEFHLLETSEVNALKERLKVIADPMVAQGSPV